VLQRNRSVKRAISLIGIQNKPLVLPGERKKSGANNREGELQASPKTKKS
jgi:hypothetical protein